MAGLIGRGRTYLLAGAALAALLPAQAMAQGAPDPRDARIDRLEAQVRALLAKVDALEAARPVATAAPSPAPVASAAAAPRTDGSVSGLAAPGGSVAPGSPNTQLTASSAGPKAAQAAVASIVGGKPSIQSSDGRFTANLHAVMQFDTAQYFQDTPGPLASDLRRGAAAGDTAHARDLSSGTDFRRARLGIEGRAFGDFEYNALLDFGGSGEEDAGHIQELWIQYSGLKPFHARVGAFPPQIGLEDQGSTNGMPFLERPASADIARSVAGGDFREAAQLVANSDRWLASLAVTGRLVGVVNSTASGVTQPFDSQLGYVGRVAAVPFKGDDWMIHLGAHGSWVARPADAAGPDVAAGAARYAVQFRERPELRVDATRLIDTGGVDADHAYSAGVEFAAQLRNFWLQAEYENLGIERRNSALSDPSFSGWYVEGSWILTGEARRYNTGSFAFDAPPVNHPFDWKTGHWGAFELALRYSDIDLNYHAGGAGTAPAADAVRGGDQTIFTAGLNWYWNPIVRFMFDFQDVDISRLSPNAVTFATPVGAQIGQHYQTVAVRSQFAF